MNEEFNNKTCQHNWTWTGDNPRQICSKCGADRDG